MTNLCFHLAKPLAVGPGSQDLKPKSFSAETYQQWRDTELRSQFLDNFDADCLRGRDVLDFGCGEGDLSFLVARMGARSVTGTELDPDLVQSALRHRDQLRLPVRPEFHLAADSRRIDLADALMDAILCFDVLEHVMDYQEIVPEWRRVLRPGGEVLIWWMPWLHPYGHHVRTLVPLPWAHVFFSEKVLIETCARIYDLPEFKPRLWDQDEQGRKKPNKWRELTELPTVNRLTISRFEKVVRGAGFEIAYRRLAGLKKSIEPATRWLTQLPVLREYFSSYVVYRLRKES